MVMENLMSVNEASDIGVIPGHRGSKVGARPDLIAMISTWQRLNGATTADGEQRIRQFIESRKIDLKGITKRIEEEETQTNSCDNAIYNLETAICDGRKILKAHDDNLSTLKSLRERLSDAFSLLSWETKPEKTSEALCGEFKEGFVISTDKNNKLIQDQIEFIDTEVRKLCEKNHRLEIDLEMWRFSRKLSQSALDQMRSTSDTIKEDIGLAGLAFRALWRIPANVWVAIFDCVRQEEMDDYLTRVDRRTLRPVVNVLSHVCYYWGRIVDEEPLLWTTVYAPPTQAWKYHEYDLLVSSARKSNRPLTLLVNMEQQFTSTFGYDPSQRFEKDNSIAPTLVPDKTRILRGVPFGLHLKMTNDYSRYRQRISHVPSRQASSVIIQSESNLCNGLLFDYVSYQAAKSLTMISPWATCLPVIDIGKAFPQISCLNLSIRHLPGNMPLAAYLPPVLEELHIRHEPRANFPSLSTGIQLPKLRKLGLTHGSMDLLEAASMPTLRTLILYGSSEYSEVHQIRPNDNAEQNYRRVTELEFREWGVVVSQSTDSGALSLLQKLVSKMKALQSIKFADSFVAGEFLITVVNNARDDSDSGSLKALKEVTLSKFTGITRSQCDTLAKLVTKLNIYV